MRGSAHRMEAGRQGDRQTINKVKRGEREKGAIAIDSDKKRKSRGNIPGIEKLQEIAHVRNLENRSLALENGTSRVPVLPAVSESSNSSKKRKCDRMYPVCSYCQRSSTECVYRPTQRAQINSSGQAVSQTPPVDLPQSSSGMRDLIANILICARPGSAVPDGLAPYLQLVQELLDLYFQQHYNRADYFFCLHPPSFWQSLHAQSPILILAMCACAAPYSRHPSIIKLHKLPFYRGLPFYNAMKGLMGQLLEGDASLEKIIIYSCASKAPSITGDYMKRAWIYATNAFRMAIDLKIDVDPDDLCAQYGIQMSEFEKELRRRIFWSVWNLGMFGYAVMTIGLDFLNNNITVKQPRGEAYWLALHPALDAEFVFDVPHTPCPLVTQIDLQCNFFRRIFQYKQVYSDHPFLSRNEMKALEIEYEMGLDSIHSELSLWFQSLPQEYLDIDHYKEFTAALNPNSTQQPWALITIHFLYQFLLIALHKPAATKAMKQNPPLSLTDLTSIKSVIYCLQALANVSRLYEEKVFPSNPTCWYLPIIVGFFTFQSVFFYSSLLKEIFTACRKEFSMIPYHNLRLIKHVVTLVRAINNQGEYEGIIAKFHISAMQELRNLCHFAGLPVELIGYSAESLSFGHDILLDVSDALAQGKEDIFMGREGRQFINMTVRGIMTPESDPIENGMS